MFYIECDVIDGKIKDTNLFHLKKELSNAANTKSNFITFYVQLIQISCIVMLSNIFIMISPVYIFNFFLRFLIKYSVFRIFHIFC